jgi:hypothetical protein
MRRRGDAMKTFVGMFLMALVTTSAGCAQKDWIDRTLVTMDVTGSWYGSSTGNFGREIFLELKQEGSRVTGFVRTARYSVGSMATSAIDGTVAGDVFRFRDSRGDLEGELTVSGDEMTGQVSVAGIRSISLRRVNPSSPSVSPPR